LAAEQVGLSFGQHWHAVTPFVIKKQHGGLGLVHESMLRPFCMMHEHAPAASTQNQLAPPPLELPPLLAPLPPPVPEPLEAPERPPVPP
jgi:hypothetical protein